MMRFRPKKSNKTHKIQLVLLSTKCILLYVQRRGNSKFLSKKMLRLHIFWNVASDWNFWGWEKKDIVHQIVWHCGRGDYYKHVSNVLTTSPSLFQKQHKNISNIGCPIKVLFVTWCRTSLHNYIHISFCAKWGFTWPKAHICFRNSKHFSSIYLVRVTYSSYSKYDSHGDD